MVNMVLKIHRHVVVCIHIHRNLEKVVNFQLKCCFRGHVTCWNKLANGKVVHTMYAPLEHFSCSSSSSLSDQLTVLCCRGAATVPYSGL